jgi:PAS domain S-box-containing protein
MRFEPAPVLTDDAGRVASLERHQILDTAPEESFDRLIRLASLLTGAPIALISLVDQDRQWFKARVGLDATETGRDISFCGHAIASEEIMVVPDALLDDRFADNPLVLGAPFIRFYAGVPLVARDGHRLGTLCVIDTEPRAGLSVIETDGLQDLARTVMDELEFRLAREDIEDQRAQLARYYEVMGATSDLMGLADAEGRVIGLNPAGRRMLGFGPEEDLGGPEISEFHTPEFNEMFWTEIHPVLIRTGIWRGESVLINRNGDEITVDQVLLAHRDADGVMTSLSTVCRDLSERDEITRLRQLQVMKDTFVSTVSHELRTPLTSISVSLSMLTDGLLGSLDEESLQVLRIARANADRLTNLIDDILDLERTEYGDRVLSFRRVQVHELLTSALLSVEGTAAVTGATIELDSRVDTALAITCAPDRITRVLVNLLTNAIKYSGIGSTIVLGVEAGSDGLITFSVSDNGIGIREESMPHLFDPFWQADSSASRTVQGSGLGLAICRRIVEKHGGFFEVDSTYGEGSTFRFTIPMD